MFGGAPAGGGLFGGAPAAGGGLFGGAPAAGGFGAAPAAGGGLFGGAAPAAGGGLFGGAAPAAGGGLFGAPAPAAGGGLFGAPAAGGGMFGAPAAAASDPNAMEANFKQIGEEFAKVYYQTYDSNRAGLAQFYEAQSCFTFEGESVQGTQQITQKLQTLPFQQVQHAPSSCHGQPVPGSPDKVLLLVTGSMMVNGSQNVKFAEVFQLMKKPTGGWFILNNTFKVVQ